MPTQKLAKGTRKLKQRQSRTNFRRLSKGKKPLPFSAFVGISRKRNRKEYEKEGEENEQQGDDVNALERSSKKSRVQKEAVSNEFGFGEEVNNLDNEPVIQELQEDIESAKESSESEGEAEDLIPTMLEDNSKKSTKLNSRQLKEELEAYQTNLENLKNDDPEFYKHLKESGEELLKFGGESLAELNQNEDTLEEDTQVFDREDDDTGVNGDVEEEEEKKGKKKKKKSKKSNEESMDVNEEVDKFNEDGQEPSYQEMDQGFDPLMAKELTVSQLDAIIEKFESNSFSQNYETIIQLFIRICAIMHCGNSRSLAQRIFCLLNKNKNKSKI